MSTRRTRKAERVRKKTRRSNRQDDLALRRKKRLQTEQTLPEEKTPFSEIDRDHEIQNDSTSARRKKAVHQNRSSNNTTINENDENQNNPSDQQNAGKKQKRTHEQSARLKHTRDSPESNPTADQASSDKRKRKHLLNHQDESSGFVRGAGYAMRMGIQTIASPEKEEEDEEEQNVGVQSANAARRSTVLAGRTLRKRSIRSQARRTENTGGHKEKAAETEKRKKDQIHAFYKKKRQKATYAAKQQKSLVSAGGFVESALTSFSIPEKAKKPVQGFFSEHKGIVISAAALLVMLLLIAVSVTSCGSIVQGGSTTIIETSYTSLDSDIYAAENAYCTLEDVLNVQVNSFETSHPGYDEYNYQIDEIEHNPYHLISYLQVKFGAFLYDDNIAVEIQSLFEAQYTLSVSETSETRTRTETVTETVTTTDPETGETITTEVEVEQEVEYVYKTLYVVLTNNQLDIVCRSRLTDEEIILYNALNKTYGNRPYLFDLDSISSGGSSGIQYTIPPEALSDEKFANMIAEAEKYLGYSYVWGGKSPSTGFDCSGFVCWVINHCGNGWDIGQKSANGLYNYCIYVSPEDARPGDLIFFEKTYNTSGASHVGIYVGDGVMIHCGNPIKYSSINTSYYKSHFLSFGRLPFYDD